MKSGFAEKHSPFALFVLSTDANHNACKFCDRSKEYTPHIFVFSVQFPAALLSLGNGQSRMGRTLIIQRGIGKLSVLAERLCEEKHSPFAFYGLSTDATHTACKFCDTRAVARAVRLFCNRRFEIAMDGGLAPVRYT